MSCEITEKKSRFISHIAPITNEENVISFINGIKTKYWDASHNVYAYVLRENAISRYSDDGEPLGTAGIPTLNVIQKEELLDVCIVTTRYFGGTLLGAGGLVRAYTKAAKSAVDAAGIFRRIYCDLYNINTEYSMVGKIQNAAANAGCIMGETAYTDNVQLQYFVPYNILNFKDIIKEVTGAKAIITKQNKGEYISV
ncbi:MAG: YigZ family protein [Clostridiaceae bacterium]|nr:YigZ family protein [Clostridiaceae bacterium]